MQLTDHHARPYPSIRPPTKKQVQTPASAKEASRVQSSWTRISRGIYVILYLYYFDIEIQDLYVM